MKHIGYNTDPYLSTDYCAANISWEYIYKVTIMFKKIQQIYIHKATNIIKKLQKMDLKEFGSQDANWLFQTQDRAQCPAQVNSSKKKDGILLTS
jgi:uridylate kinase